MCVKIGLILLLLLSTVVKGQDIQIGLKGGIGTAFLNGSYVSNEAFAGAYAIGGIMNAKLKGVISFQSELYYSKKGSAYRLQYTDSKGNLAGESKLSYKLHYLEIPLCIKFTSKDDATRVYFMTGVSPAILLTGNSKFIGYRTKLTNVNLVDIGLNNSIGLEFNAGKKLSFIELRMNNGLTEVFEFLPYKNFTFCLMTGVRF